MQAVTNEGMQTLILTGELDLASGAELDETIRRLCRTGTAGLVIDLRKLSFIDSTGVKSMLQAGRLCEEHGHEFRLIPGPRNIQRIFEVTGLDRALPFVGSPAS
ncbi:MAG: anti-sigma factor antagonist [Solirubrobacteraceae bacterium]|nr:anti-sigma factor antagonist [Solirubrobacteraceae bacterium]